MFDVLYTLEYADIDSNTVVKENYFKIYYFYQYSTSVYTHEYRYILGA